MTVVRVVVLNYEGGDDLVRAVDALAATRTDASVQMVVVDNGSTDGSVGRGRGRATPRWRCAAPAPTGGSAANNDALGDLDGIDYVALVNNDAFVEPGWLDPLVDALAADDGLGAVAGQDPVRAPLRGGARRDPGLGPPLRTRAASGCSCGGRGWTASTCGRGVHVAAGRSGPTLEGRPGWSGPRRWAVVRVPVDAAADGRRRRVELLVATEEPKRVRLAGADGAVELEVSARAPLGRGAPGRQPVRRDQQRRRRAAGRRQRRATAACTERDDGPVRPSRPIWTPGRGGAVLLRPAYLADVGLFDERFFLYYEDTDLSARGRARGWRYRLRAQLGGAPPPRGQLRGGQLACCAGTSSATASCT